MISKVAQMYCREDISLIENYEKAIKDDKMWIVHHRLEIELNKSQQELIDEGLYYARPASELIFLTNSQHLKLHNHNRKPRPKKPIVNHTIPERKTYKKPLEKRNFSAFWMFYFYVVKKMTQKRIAAIYDTNQQVIYYWMHKFGITKKLQKTFGENL